MQWSEKAKTSHAEKTDCSEGTVRWLCDCFSHFWELVSSLMSGTYWNEDTFGKLDSLSKGELEILDVYYMFLSYLALSGLCCSPRKHESSTLMHSLGLKSLCADFELETAPAWFFADEELLLEAALAQAEVAANTAANSLRLEDDVIWRRHAARCFLKKARSGERRLLDGCTTDASGSWPIRWLRLKAFLQCGPRTTQTL